MNSTRLYLLRHGQVVNHHEYRYNGHYDVDITDEGVRQMERLSEFLSDRGVSAVYSSDLQRAVKGADIISASLGLKPGRVSELRELSLGRWEGLTRQEAATKFPEESGFRFRDLATSKVQGGETLCELKNRVLPAIDRIIAAHPGESVCVVAHGGVNRVVLCESMGLPLENFFRIEQDYGCLNLIDCFHDGIRVVKLLNGGPNQLMDRTVLY